MFRAIDIFRNAERSYNYKDLGSYMGVVPSYIHKCVDHHGIRDEVTNRLKRNRALRRYEDKPEHIMYVEVLPCNRKDKDGNLIDPNWTAYDFSMNN